MGRTPDTREAIAELRSRIDAIEARLDQGTTPGPALDAEVFWLLDRLARNTGPGFERDGVEGSIAYGGRVRAPGVDDVVWQMEHPAADALDADADHAAQVLGALGHPRRLAIVRALLEGSRTLAELQELPGMGTSGQVHHHLRELRGAGIVVNPRRNHYAIPADRVVPHLVILAAALGRSLTSEPEA